MPWRGIPLFRLAGAKRPLEVHPDVARKRCLENECHRLPGHGIGTLGFGEWVMLIISCTLSRSLIWTCRNYVQARY